MRAFYSEIGSPSEKPTRVKLSP